MGMPPAYKIIDDIVKHPGRHQQDLINIAKNNPNAQKQMRRRQQAEQMETKIKENGRNEVSDENEK